MNNNGALVISLDFELLWGVFDKVDWKSNQEYFYNTRKVIPTIIKLFEEHDIACTWATVGMLFNKNWDEWNSNIPNEIPDYINPRLSAYNFGKSIHSKHTEKLCFAPDIIKLILNSPKQEIGTHTYSHYYCLEEGQNLSHFRNDIKKASDLASQFGIKLESLVFPRNQFNVDYKAVCREFNICNIRSNPENWYWKDTQKAGLAQKICRTLDAYLGPRDKIYNRREMNFRDDIFEQKASRFLRPYTTTSGLNKLKLLRVLNEMEVSAREGGVYHLWWHPHNFGAYPGESIRDLCMILSKYVELRKKFGYQSLSMRDLGNNIQ